MIAPMNDRTFIVVPVIHNASVTPVVTDGTAKINTIATRTDWKYAASKRNTAMMDTSSPNMRSRARRVPPSSTGHSFLPLRRGAGCGAR